MKRFFTLLLLLGTFVASAQTLDHYRRPVGKVRNVIVMIPDGTSTSTLSIARWYQQYNKAELTTLNLDEILCGVVGTFASNSPIPDSSAAMSAYMTGMPANSSTVSIYPVSKPGNDIIEIDTLQSWRPLATLLEAAKYEKGMATGLVATTLFCHATPAACASHHHSRSAYSTIASQIVANNVDVVIGGGRKYLSESNRAELSKRDATLIFDPTALREYKGQMPLWALIAEGDMDYEIDRDDATTPSLAENTRLAIELLSEDKDGFFLMVEGSRVDHAAHGNDAGAILHELLAFDRAVGEALKFAKRDGETLVVVMPDHGTAAMTFGKGSYKNYSKRGLEDGFKVVSGYSASAEALEKKIKHLKKEEIGKIFVEEMAIELTDEELELLIAVRDRKEKDYMKVAHSLNLYSAIAQIITSRTPFCFASGNHTSEDVFLAAYHPTNDLPQGRNTNSEINAYIADAMALKMPLRELTDEIFAPHTSLFKAEECDITTEKGKRATLTVKHGRHTLLLEADTSTAILDGKEVKLGSVVVYSPKSKLFYLPRNLAKNL